MKSESCQSVVVGEFGGTAIVVGQLRMRGHAGPAERDSVARMARAEWKVVMDTPTEGRSDPGPQPPNEGECLFLGTALELAEYASKARSYLEILQGAGSVRLLVLETWLFVDYTVRELLLSGLGLERLDDDELDLRYNLLPGRFPDCLRLLEKLRDANQRLPEKPEPPLQFSARKLLFFEKYDRDMFNRMWDAEQSYRQACQLGPPPALGVLDRTRYRWLTEGWLSVANQIDKTWVDRATRLNDARNLAAHSHDEQRIAAKLGFNGPKIASHVKNECARLVEQLVGLSTEAAWVQFRLD